MDYFNQTIMNLYQNISYIVSSLTVIVHLFCTLAVIRDLSNFSNHYIKPQMMPNFAWMVSVLISGIWGLLIYWIMHHSSLSRR